MLAAAQHDEMWDILSGNPRILLDPPDAACSPGERFCVPGAVNAARTDSGCFALACTPQSAAFSSAVDGNLATSFVTRTLDQFNLTVDFRVRYQVSQHARLHDERPETVA